MEFVLWKMVGSVVMMEMSDLSRRNFGMVGSEKKKVQPDRDRVHWRTEPRNHEARFKPFLIRTSINPYPPR